MSKTDMPEDKNIKDNKPEDKGLNKPEKPKNKKPDYFCISCKKEYFSIPPNGYCASCGKPKVRKREVEKKEKEKPVDIIGVSSLKNAELKNAPRIRLDISNLSFLDLALGGDEIPGLIIGSHTILAGQSGAGKSSVSIPVAIRYTELTKEKVLIASSEEDEAAVKNRAVRFGGKGNDRILILAKRGLTVNEIKQACILHKPGLVIIDSIQEVAGEGSDPHKYEDFAKFFDEQKITSFCINQFTKDGNFAGSNKLKHKSDVFLLLDKDEVGEGRTLKVDKNRGGGAGLFYRMKMTRKGLVDEIGADGILPDERESISGCVACPVIIGKSVKIIEIICNLSEYDVDEEGNVVKRSGKRTSFKINSERLEMICSFIEDKCGIPMSRDVYIEAITDDEFVINDPGIDLAIAATIISQANRYTLPTDCAIFGSIDVLGRVGASHDEERIKALISMGYKSCCSSGKKTQGFMVYKLKRIEDIMKSWPKYHLSTDILGDEINHKGLDKKLVESIKKESLSDI